MIARGRVKRLEAAHRSRHRGTGGGFAVGIEDKATGTVTVGDQVLTAQEWEALEVDVKITIPKREEVTNE